MKNILFLVGVGTILIGVILGVYTMIQAESILLGMGTMISVSVGGLIYLALSQILENQEKLLQQPYQNAEQYLNFQTSNGKQVTCEQCGKQYTEDRASCPYCGRKNS